MLPWSRLYSWSLLFLKGSQAQNELLLMIKPLNTLLSYNLAEKIRPKGQKDQSRPPCRNLAQVGKERIFSGPLFHAYHCPRGKEGWGVMENKGCRVCTLITPWRVPGSGIGTQLIPVGSLTSCRKGMQGGSGLIGEYHNLKWQKWYFLWFLFLASTRKVLPLPVIKLPLELQWWERK